MKNIVEILRAPSPAPLPQALAFDGQHLWMGSIETDRIYEIDAQKWTVRQESAAPGKPWGMTAAGEELRVICGEGDDDNRFIRRFVPGHGFKSEALPCPENTGSQLSYDGTHLCVSQWYNKRVLTLDADGNVIRTLASPRGICGQLFFEGHFYLLNTNDEESSEYFITKIDPAGDRAHDLARVPFHGRALAFDGSKFWTNHRENNEIVAFTVPD